MLILFSINLIKLMIALLRIKSEMLIFWDEKKYQFPHMDEVTIMHVGCSSNGMLRKLQNASINTNSDIFNQNWTSMHQVK
uniref:Uncharacterized protein n=1 Tax=Arundo donax TaxID=35708 RepID=A0A0A8Z5H4_ARUDO